MSDTNAQLHRDVGRIEGRIGALENVTRDMQGKVDEMHTALMQAQGGWRVMVMVGGIAAATGALAAKLFAWLWPR